MRKILLLVFLVQGFFLLGQHGYWQQEVDYVMDIDFDVNTHQFSGVQLLTYTNNSPDTLDRVYYHIYFNAFQPNSMMDVRSRSLEDPDRRVRDRISKLTPDEIGFHEIESLLQDGKEVSYRIESTIVEVDLVNPILPGMKTQFEMKFKSQVPVQIRRSGRNNREGISYSMSQWFPKLAEYDKFGWHAHPYVAREFYAPWGNYAVNITLAKEYVVAGSGVLQNPEEIGYGYAPEGMKIKRPKGKTLTWRFVAENVHDFMWAADPDYTHTTRKVENGPLLHFFYQTDTLVANWESLPDIAAAAFTYQSKTFGRYPYDHFYVVQGGDGGMEYPMSTLITGHRSLESLVGVTVHEAMHSWYQGVLATNESYLAWMDEGYTSYATSRTMNYLMGDANTRPASSSYRGYFALASSGKEEPMTTHSDHYNTNFGYGRAAYSKGAVSLAQLGYIVGEDKRDIILRKYFDQWKFKHPQMSDFIKVAEKESGLELDWYYDYWIGTTKQIDYAIDTTWTMGEKTQVQLSRRAEMPMPVELIVTKKDGSQVLYYIPLGIMRGEKENESGIERSISADWYWTHPTYILSIDLPLSEIESLEIDPSERMADVDPSNNVFRPE